MYIDYVCIQYNVCVCMHMSAHGQKESIVCKKGSCHCGALQCYGATTCKNVILHYIRHTTWGIIKSVFVLLFFNLLQFSASLGRFFECHL